MRKIEQLKSLVNNRKAEKHLLSFLKENMDLFGDWYSVPPGYYIAFSEFPFGEGRCDFVLFTSTSRMEVIVIEVKGADFTFSTADGAIAAQVNFAAKQVRDRFEHIEANREQFRRRAHDLRRRVESGETVYNSQVGPGGNLLVDPEKDVTWRGIVIGGVARDEIYESRERTKLELNTSPHVRYESWNSFLEKLEPRESPPRDPGRWWPVIYGGPPIPVGTRVRTMIDYASVPKGTEGMVDAHWGALNTLIMVAWDLPDRSLPEGYRKFDPHEPNRRILRDGFSADEAKTLEVVSRANPRVETDG